MRYDTLFLPATDFPMRAGLPKREPDWLGPLGTDRRLRPAARKRPPGASPSSLHDGPPYANGHLHIGHALNKILKDIIVRSHQMLGRDSRYIPGWDCHGLPIEWKIEEQYREKGQNKDEVTWSSSARNAAASPSTGSTSSARSSSGWASPATGTDPYLTMDFHAERVIAEEFMVFLMNGTLYQGSKPVMWSPVEKTALAEAEVEYHDRQRTRSG
jgi:isoleucyl-tRNA synthetase